MSLFEGSRYLPQPAARKTLIVQQAPKRFSIGLILLGLATVIPLAVLIIVVFITTVLSSPLADPFAAYDSLRPGNPSSALSGYPCDTLYDFPYTRDMGG